jgi:hypothetical protein
VPKEVEIGLSSGTRKTCASTQVRVQGENVFSAIIRIHSSGKIFGKFGRDLRVEDGLWIADVDLELSWASEIKQHFAAARSRQSTIDARLNAPNMPRNSSTATKPTGARAEHTAV